MKYFAILLFALLGVAASIDCDSDEISCSNEEKCIPQRYICDSDEDCEDGSDEISEICEIWKNDKCSRNEVICKRNDEESCLNIQSYCTSENPPCEGDLDRRLCLMLESGKLDTPDKFILQNNIKQGNLNKSAQLGEKFKDLIPHTMRHPDCPPMYTLVGDQCLSVFYIGSMSWSESREFCKILGGDLLTFRNVSQFAAVAQHLTRYEIQSDFWIGGRIENASQGWTWVDGTPVELGTPFWATRYRSTCVERNVTTADSETVCYRYYQAPEAEPKGQCLSLSFEQYFFQSDDDCVKKMSPLCVYQGEDSKFRKSFLV